MLLPLVGVSRDSAGRPEMNTIGLPIVVRPGPLIMPVRSPPIAPASSPLVITFIVPMLVAGMKPIITLGENGAACMFNPMSG